MATSAKTEQLDVKIDPEVTWLYRSIVWAPDHTYVFVPYTKDGEELLPLIHGGPPDGITGSQCKMTGITQNNDILSYTPKLNSIDVRMYAGQTHHFMVNEKFHYAYCIPPFTYEQDSSGKFTANPVM